MSAPGPVSVKQLLNDGEAAVRGVLGLPGLVAAVQQLAELAPEVRRIAGITEKLDDLAAAVPASSGWP